jgi:hypothetical protein
MSDVYKDRAKHALDAAGKFPDGSVHSATYLQISVAASLLAVVERLDRIAAMLERADESHVVLGGPDAPTPVWPERGERS